MVHARRFTIEGRVQGVWFRDSTRKQAAALGLTGHALNLPNGDVEVLACGEAAALNELGAWLQTGPPLAEVRKAIEDTVEWQDVAGFSIA